MDKKAKFVLRALIISAAISGLVLLPFVIGGKAKAACNDDVDNDGDGYCDYNGCSGMPADPGCVNKKDTTETNSNIECDDYMPSWANDNSWDDRPAYPTIERPTYDPNRKPRTWTPSWQLPPDYTTDDYPRFPTSKGGQAHPQAGIIGGRVPNVQEVDIRRNDPRQTTKRPILPRPTLPRQMP